MNAGPERRQRRQRRERRQRWERTGSYRSVAGPNFKRSQARSETSKIALFRRGRENGANHFTALPASLALSALSALPALPAFQPGARGVPDDDGDLGAYSDPNWQVGSKAFIVSCGTS